MKITRGHILKTGLPALAAACFCVPANAQLPGGNVGNTGGTVGVDLPDNYTCSAEFSYTHQDQLVSTLRSFQCNNTLTYLGGYYDLADGMVPALVGEYATLKCIDFSMWSTESGSGQTVFVRVYQDLNALTLGPDTNPAEGMLVSEDSFLLPPDGGWVNSNPTNTCCQGHPAGDKSITITGLEGLIGGDSLGYLLLPDSKFWVEVGHEGESRTRHGTYSDVNGFFPAIITPGTAERRDHVPALDYAGTWARNTNGCTGFANWGLQETVWGNGTDRDFPLQLHFDSGDTTKPPSLPFGCPSDFTGPEDAPDGEVGILDFLGILANWGAGAPPRPTGDIAPCDDTFVTECRGDNAVGVLDFLEVLADWGECPNNNDECEEALNILNQAAFILVDGTYPFEYNAAQHDMNLLREATNDINALFVKTPNACGWGDYGPDGIPGGFRFGDTFGVDASGPFLFGDVFFTYLAPGNGRAFFDTAPQGGCGSLGTVAVEENPVNMIEVYPGGVCPTSWLDSIDCAELNGATDCLGGAPHATIEVNVVEGEEYLIRVGSWAGWDGPLGELTTGFADNSTCASALPIAVGGSTTGSTDGAGIEGAPDCAVGDGIAQSEGGRWYVVIGDGNTLTASTAATAAFEELFGEEPNAFDSAISVFCNNIGEGCPTNLGSFSCVASDAASVEFGNFHETVSWCSTAGQEYYILIHGNPSGPGDPIFPEGFFVLDVTSDAVACLTAAQCGVTRPGNDNCSSPTNFVASGTPDMNGQIITNIAINNNNAGTETNEAQALGCAGIDETVWYSYTPNLTGMCTFTTCNLGNNFNVTMEVYDAATAGDCPLGGPDQSLLLCIDDTIGCGLSGFQAAPILLFAGQRVLIKIGSPTAGQSGAQQGTGTLRIINQVSPSSCPQVCDPMATLEGGGDGELLLGDSFFGYSNLDISGQVGVFVAGETVTGGTSGETADILEFQTIAGVDSLLVDNVSGAFTPGETITGGTSAATAVAGTQTDFDSTILEPDFTNGGCNMCTPLFDALAEGDIVCGQISTFAASRDGDCDMMTDGGFFQRDTDWYTLTVPDTDDMMGGENRIPGSRVTLTLSTEAPTLIGITEAACGATPNDEVPFVASVTSGGLCTDTALTVDLPAGNYYVVVLPFGLSGVDVGNATEGHDYQVTVGTFAPAQLAPTNDDCDNPIDITANIDGALVVSDNRYATDDGSEPAAGCGTLAGSVWYSFVASSANMTVTTCASVIGTDSTFAVYSGDCLTPVEVGCSADECGTLGDIDLTGLTMGETYLIQLGGMDAGTQSVFRITITNTP